MKANFEREKKIFHILNLFIHATVICLSAPKLSNKSRTGHLNVEQPEIDLQQSPANLSKFQSNNKSPYNQTIKKILN